MTCNFNKYIDNCNCRVSDILVCGTKGKTVDRSYSQETSDLLSGQRLTVTTFTARSSERIEDGSGHRLTADLAVAGKCTQFLISV